MKLAIAELVPLELQLTDGSTVMFPRALVYDASGTLIATKDLAHVANGRYANDTLTMPSTGYVAATYIVYSDSGHTTLAGYGRTVDVWQLQTATPAAIATAILNAVIDGAKTVRGALTRMDAFVKGKATGLAAGSSTGTFYAADGVTPVIVASQDTTAGTRAAASTAGGD